MSPEGREALAWVESPLQFVAAAEYAAAHDRRVSVAFRLTDPQMTSTARELLDRGAPFTHCAPYYGVPWALLARHRDWIVGDAFSGQFRAALSTLGARSVVAVDDGVITVSLARALLGATGYHRPGQRESRLRVVLGGLSRERLLRLAARDRMTLFTVFSDDAAVAALPAHGITVETDELAWTRATARPAPLPHPRVVLGSAQVADGILPLESYLGWLADVARQGPVSYLPHRRESAELLEWVALLPGVELVRTALPVELVLAGHTEPLEIVSLTSSAATTLRHVLAGTGSVIRTTSIPQVVR